MKEITLNNTRKIPIESIDDTKIFAFSEGNVIYFRTHNTKSFKSFFSNGYYNNGSLQTDIKDHIKLKRKVYQFDDLRDFLRWSLSIVGHNTIKEDPIPNDKELLLDCFNSMMLNIDSFNTNKVTKSEFVNKRTLIKKDIQKGIKLVNQWQKKMIKE